MTVITDQLTFLGLKDREIRVFTALSTFGRMNMTKISSRAGLSRTTVDAIVRRLMGQGLVAQEKVSGHFEYAVKLHEVADRLDWIEKRLRPATGDVSDTSVSQPCDSYHPSSNLDTPHSTLSCGEKYAEIGVQGGGVTAGQVDSASIVNSESMIMGHASMHDMVESAFASHHGERAVMLLATLVTGEKRMQRLEHCLSYARQAEMKLEILTTTDVSKALSVYAREILALLTSYDLRLNFLPPSFCIEATDLLAFRDVVIVVDHHADVVERIEGTRMVAVINHLLRVAREAGWGMDIKMWLEGIIASQHTTG
ncbi:MAG: helix-turn-helix domain-containing protein [Candidatus Pacebacteria bacterium]|nr:helix-turn-helix domain-containing protein [Candidatus Paceibacterota bacterium]